MKRLATIALMAILVAACQQQGKTPENASPEAKPGLSVSGGELVLPAVMGNPGAAYFTVSNNGANPATLAAVSIEGVGSTMMHETTPSGMGMLESITVPAGGSVSFVRGGKHVMAMGLPGKALPGEQLEMTLIFADGDKVSTPLKVVKASDAGMGSSSGNGAAH